MGALELIGAATGIGFLAGLRLYATVLSLGLIIRFHLIKLPPELASLTALSNNWVLGVAAVAFLIEFAADKIPWVDSAWDAIHTFIRPVGATLLAFAALGQMTPEFQILVALLTGAVALTSHSMKSATRLAVNQSPEPVSNSLLSLAGDVVVPFGVWFTVEHPLLVGSIVAIAVLAFLLVAPKVIRLMRVETSALVACTRRLLGRHTDPVDSLPSAYRNYITGETGGGRPAMLRAVGRDGVGSLRHSIGYLMVSGQELVFVTRKWRRYRTFRFPLSTAARLEHRRGVLMDRIVCRNEERTCEFGVFKDGPELETVSLRTATSV